MNLSLIFVCAILGLVVGSFLNACVYRLRIREFKSIFFGRSFCVSCKATLQARDLIPLVSFLLLKRKCRFCGKKISSHYFWVELITFLTFALVAYFTPIASPSLLVWNLLFASILIFLASFDFQFGEIPDEVSLPSSLIALGGSLFIFTPLTFIESFLGLILGGGFFLILVLISKGKWMGGGDIRMGLLLGSLLGWKGFIVALLISTFVGSIVGIIQIILKNKKLKSEIPFAPYLALGGILAILFTQKAWEWYTSDLLLLL